jgi:hypothetical protein
MIYYFFGGNEEMSVKCRILSSLVKVFPNETPVAGEISGVECFLNETVSFQVAFTETDLAASYPAQIIIDSPIKKYIRLRAVRLIPLLSPFSPADGNYLKSSPGMYPDLLSDVKNNWIRIYGGQWHSVWIDAEPSGNSENPEDLPPAGTYPVRFSIVNEKQAALAECETAVTIFPASLPKQTLRHTRWFHSDCLAEYYGAEAFSERHWEIIENFVKAAVKRGINMILTPMFTPALDTGVGLERLTTQLVDVSLDDGGRYSFGFDKLSRWIDMCQRCGAEYFEMSHLFTQWGAKAAPKIMAAVNGEYKRIFGWDTPALGEDYKAFLNAFLPEIAAHLKKSGIQDRCYFHISDEPHGDEMFAQYSGARAIVKPHLEGFKIMDALSDIEFYKKGIIEYPVPATYEAEEFIKAGMAEPWTYYCCAQTTEVSNMFPTLPSARNRIIGAQFYKFGIEGFLHWGYNFYNTVNSYKRINPYLSLDESGFGYTAAPADGYQVYPGSDGKPEESLRFMIFWHALCDMRTFQMLESLTDKNYVVGLIEEGLTEPLTFYKYPRGDDYILNLRRRVNSEILERI